MKGKENGEHYELSPQVLNEWAPVSGKWLGDEWEVVRGCEATRAG